ncbi:MAG: DedA family protein [Deltaproteobacteria bacterium]|nr:DedA family protein [Deltaproteobacteria bacterium]
MPLEQLITNYGYIIIFFGTLLEGETVLVLAGFLAHRGYLELPLVIITAFAGSFIGDQFFFYLGRIKGISLIERHLSWKAKYDRASALLHKHQIPVILCFRFIYGMRTITPFLIGLSRVKPSIFFLLNGIGALLWAVVIGFLGYFIGNALELIFQEVRRYEIIVIITIICIGVIIWSYHFIRGSLKKW